MSFKEELAEIISSTQGNQERLQKQTEERVPQQQFELISPLIEHNPSDDWATVRRKFELTAAKGMFDSDSDAVLDEM
jgi:hypothetical protein